MPSPVDISKASSAGPPHTDAEAIRGAAPYPAVVVDLAGRVVELNDAASALFPDARAGGPLGDIVPPWLADAHERQRTTIPAQKGRSARAASGPVGERSFEAYPAPGTEGETVWWLAEDTERRRAEAALETERERTAFLAEASNALLSSLNVERCMEVTAQLAAEHLADAAVVISPAHRRRFPVASCRRGRAVTHGTVAVDPTTVPGLGEALQGFPPVPSRWIDPGSVPGWAIPDGFAEPVGSVVITPLPGHGVAAGALMLLRRDDRAAFTEADELFARLFAARAGAALSSARMYTEQARITDTLMRELLPPALHQVHGVEFAGGYRASSNSERIGGDFYDVHPGPGPGEESLAVLGDVCGKGLDAAVLTGKIRNTLHALLPLADDHVRMLGLLNSALINSHHTRFATLVLASARRQGSRVRLRLTSAGHPAPLIVRGSGRVEEADTRGSLVGVLPAVHARTDTVELEPGETCLLFTDGITEARGGPFGDEMFGEDRLKRALQECAGMPAAAVVERIQMLASQWMGRAKHDDMAVVAITAPRSTHLSAVNGHTPGRYTG